MRGKKEFLQASVVYFVLKLLIIAVTSAFVTCGDCSTSLLRHVIHLALFTHFIYAGMRITSSIIAVACIFRGGAYLVNFFAGTGYLLELPLTGSSLAVMQESGLGHSVFFINAVLMFAMAGMIIRAVMARGWKKEPAKEPTVEHAGETV